jgi:hypothetical protein
MKIVIYTQHRENYGAHDWSGFGECPQYWKNKGGETFVIPGLTMDQVRDWQYKQEGHMASLLCESTNYFEVTIAGVNTLADDAQVTEARDTPWILSYVEGVWMAKRYTPRDYYWTVGVSGKTEEYQMAKGNEQMNYSCKYHKEAA